MRLEFYSPPAALRIYLYGKIEGFAQQRALLHFIAPMIFCILWDDYAGTKWSLETIF